MGRAETAPAITGPFAETLKRHRDSLNAAFAAARRTDRSLDGTVFADHLVRRVAPLVDRIAEACPEAGGRGDAIGLALYAVSLEMLIRGLIGGTDSASAGLVALAWEDLFLRMPGRIAEAPRQVTASLANALFNLTTDGGRKAPTPENPVGRDWTEAMVRVAPKLESTGAVLDAGAVAAWRCGAAYLRRAALDACGRLPFSVVVSVLNLPDGSDAAYLETVLTHLRRDRWYDPGTFPDQQDKALRRAGIVGGFAGFGGPFISPPTVTVTAEREIHLRDATGAWRLHADRFGTTLKRDAGASPAADSRPAGRFKLTAGGRVIRGQATRTFPELAGAAELGDTDDTLAVRPPWSHYVHLIVWGSVSDADA